MPCEAATAAAPRLNLGSAPANAFPRDALETGTGPNGAGRESMSWMPCGVAGPDEEFEDGDEAEVTQVLGPGGEMPP